MSLTLTLIAGPGSEHDMSAAAANVAGALQGRPEPDWLTCGIAWDIAIKAATAETVEAIARTAIGKAPIDIIVQPAASRRKRLLVADMESTIIENEMLDELADFVGMREQVAEITRRAMNGELDFAAALAARVSLLRGLPVTVLDEAAARIRLMPGARELVATMHAAGARTALVSGGFTVFAKRVAQELGFDHVSANRLDIVDGRIAGTVAAPIVTRETKLETLTTLAGQYSIPLTEIVAIGDGANDLPMLQAAGLGIAFHAKPAVAAAARWRLDHTDLTGVLYAQGYRASEIDR